MINDNDIRNAVMCGSGSQIRTLLLRPDQISLVNHIYSLSGVFTAAELSKIKDISIQNASAKLRILADKGYIFKSDRSASSGGIECIYTTKEQINTVKKHWI